MAGGGDKTEKATPKRREEARKKGQIARSQDLSGAMVLIGGLIALTIWGLTSGHGRIMCGCVPMA